MSGTTLDTGALIALEAGSKRMAVLVEEALAHTAVALVIAKESRVYTAEVRSTRSRRSMASWSGVPGSAR